MTRTLLFSAVLFLVSLAATAQPRPIFDPDDFVDPRQHEAEVLVVSRMVIGVAKGSSDHFRPLHQDIGIVHIANSIYWRRVQFDYHHTETRSENGTQTLRRCDCQPPVYFPTPPSANAIPAAPGPSSRDTLRAAWYLDVGGDGARIPVMLRYRLSWSRLRFHADVESFSTAQELPGFSGRDESWSFDGDTYFRVRGRDVFGSLSFARTSQSGTVDDRSQTEITYTSRFPAKELGRVLVLPTLTIGGVTGRGAAGINVVNPQFELLWHEHRTRANLHFVWSPQTMRDGSGWATNHQVAVFIDRVLFMAMFPKAKRR